MGIVHVENCFYVNGNIFKNDRKIIFFNPVVLRYSDRIFPVEVLDYY